MIKKISKSKIMAFMVSILFFAPVVPQAQATIPQLITYHGILKNSSGSFLTGTYSMQFKIYDASTGGTALWTETQPTVSVSSGRFSVQLGSATTLNLSFNTNYWLSIKVGTDAEMTPRVRLTSAGYAYLAEDVTGGKLTGSAHAADSHMSIEGVRNAHTNIAKTNFKLDAYSLASANSMGDLIMDTFTDASGIDASSSSDYTWRGSPNYDVIAGSQGGIDSNTVLMLHGNGTDTSSTFTDSETTPKTATAIGNAQIDTAQKKFGTASGLFDATGDYLSLSDHNDFDFGTGDWTLDFWVRFNGLAQAQTFFSHGSEAAGGILLFFNTNNMLYLLVGASTSYTFSWTPSTNVWYHVAVSRSGTSLRAFIDGIQIGTTQTDSTNLTSTSGVTIGAQDSPVQKYMDGWLDEFRVSKGVARWTANFTPPTSEYTAPGGATATVISTTFSEPVAPTEAIVTASHTLGTGSITYYVSRNNGTNWTQCTNEQACNISGQPSGTQLRWKASISGNAELDAIAVAV